MQYRVTVVGGDPEVGAALGAALAEHDGAFEVDTVGTTGTVLDRLDGGDRPDCVVTDHEPPDRDAVALAREATARDPDLAVLLHVDGGTESLAADALAAGAAGYSRREDTPAAALAERVAAAARETSEARVRRERAAALSAFGPLVADPDLSLVEAVDRMLELGRERLGMEYGGLARVEGGEYRVLAAASPDDLALDAGDVLGLSEVYCELAVESERPVCFGRLPAEPEAAGRTVDTEHGFRSYVGCPVTVDGRIWGTLCFADRRERPPFADWEVELVELLGGWLRDRLTARARGVRLRRERDRLEGFAAMVEHDIREPLSTARGAVTLARETLEGGSRMAADGTGPDGDVADGHLDRAAAALSRAERFTDDLLRLSRASEQASDAVTVDVRGVAERAWEDVVTGDRPPARLRAPNSVHVPADEALLRRLLVALFEFCLDSYTGDGPLTITVGALSDRPGFYVADDGAGLPGETTARPVSGDGGTGAGTGRTGPSPVPGEATGLDGIERIAAAHDWEVTAGLSADGGARVEVGTEEGLWPEAGNAG